MKQIIDTWGRIDILVNNGAHQTVCESFEDLATKEWDKTFAVNIDAVFHLS